MLNSCKIEVKREEMLERYQRDQFGCSINKQKTRQAKQVTKNVEQEREKQNKRGRNRS